MKLEPLDVKTDDRGSLVEAFKFPNDGQVFYIIIKPGESRGNHYHVKKTETFLVIHGEAEMSVRDRTSGNLMKVSVTGQQPMSIKIVPNHTHSLYSKGGCVVLVWSDTVHNETNPDTIQEEI